MEYAASGTLMCNLFESSFQRRFIRASSLLGSQGSRLHRGFASALTRFEVIRAQLTPRLIVEYRAHDGGTGHARCGRRVPHNASRKRGRQRPRGIDCDIMQLKEREETSGRLQRRMCRLESTLVAQAAQRT